MKTVAVFFGGKSNESEISVITGMYAVNLLRSADYRVLPVYLPPEGGMTCPENARGVEDFRAPVQKGFLPVRLTEGGLARAKNPKKTYAKIDCALNCCHGGGGEGGELAALLEWYQITSASPGIAESAVFLDKILSKYALKGLGLPVADFFPVREEAFPSGEWREEAASLGYPLIVKPAKLGSSIGIAVAKDESELETALKAAFRLDGSVLVEKYLAGKRDLNCAAYRRGGEIVLSPVEEVFSSEPILTFGEKYEGGSGKKSKLPAEIGDELTAQVKDMLRRVYAQFGIKGVVRADFLLADGALYFNELNTVPGTLATYLFGERLTDARAMLISLIESALKEEKKEKKIWKSGILQAAVFGGGKRRGESAAQNPEK